MKFEFFDGTNWYTVASENFVNTKVFDINSNTNGQLNVSRLSGYPTNSSLYLRGDGVWANPLPVQSIVHGYLYNTQNSNLAVNDHIKFDNISFIRSNNINLDTSSTYTTATNVASIGRVTLAAGKTYKLTAITCTAAFTATNGYIGLKWYNSDNNSPLGTVNTWWGSNWNYTSGGAVVAFINTTVNTRVELRISSVFNITQIWGAFDANSATWFVIEEV